MKHLLTFLAKINLKKNVLFKCVYLYEIKKSVSKPRPPTTTHQHPTHRHICGGTTYVINQGNPWNEYTFRHVFY